MKKKILVVDDDTMLAELIKRVLELNGYAATMAHSGEEAISFLKERGFDLVLCDIHMHGRDGFSVLTASKAMHPLTRVILCSGNVCYATVSKAFHYGADSFLAKPFSASSLRRQVGSCLGQKQQEEIDNMGPTAARLEIAGFA